MDLFKLFCMEPHQNKYLRTIFLIFVNISQWHHLILCLQKASICLDLAIFFQKNWRLWIFLLQYQSILFYVYTNISSFCLFQQKINSKDRSFSHKQNFFLLFWWFCLQTSDLPFTGMEVLLRTPSLFCIS
jgi:hypothetical protein